MERRHASVTFGIPLALLSAFACETRETIGQVTAREIQIQEPDSDESASIVLNAGTITLVDKKGRKSVLSATGIQFFSADGKLVGEAPATLPP